MTARPFVKWVGGKTQLLEKIRSKYPENIEKYCEPFVGGGAVLFDVLSTYHPEEVLINDINPELINTYRHIKDSTEELIAILKEYENEYYRVSDKKELYLNQRERFNSLIQNKVDSVEKAALFIMLNKTCFNGLYRVNARGLFNVPFNNATRPTICDEENIRSCGALLKDVKITLGDYSLTGSFIDERTFVYVDPPYRPLTVSSYFTSYNETGFGDKEQIELGRFLSEMSAKGASLLISNSDPKNVNENDEFFDDLYRDFIIDRVKASRMINSRASGRGPVSELLINNSYLKEDEKNGE